MGNEKMIRVTKKVIALVECEVGPLFVGRSFEGLSTEFERADEKIWIFGSRR